MSMGKTYHIRKVEGGGVSTGALKKKKRVLVSFPHSATPLHEITRNLVGTKVDLSLRNARGIPTSEFTLPPGFSKQSMKPGQGSSFPVRVKSCKIHLYEHGGHFKSHCDTPEVDLVGHSSLG